MSWSVTFSKPREMNSLVAQSAMRRRISRFFRSRTPSFSPAIGLARRLGSLADSRTPSILRRITVTFTTVNFCYPLDMKTRRVDVAVVGAGPTGLLLAGELVLNGVGVVVIERRTEPDPTPKAGGLGVLAGEALERRGLGAALDAEEAAALEAMKAMRTSLTAAAGGSAKPAGPLSGKFGK